MTGHHYTDEDIGLIFRCQRNEHNAQALAEICGRKPSSIHWVWRHIEENRGIGPRPSMRLVRQIRQVRTRLGEDQRGIIQKVSTRNLWS